MFVPSLSRQNDHLSHKMRKKTRFLTCVIAARKAHERRLQLLERVEEIAAEETRHRVRRKERHDINADLTRSAQRDEQLSVRCRRGGRQVPFVLCPSAEAVACGERPFSSTFPMFVPSLSW